MPGNSLLLFLLFADTYFSSLYYCSHTLSLKIQFLTISLCHLQGQADLIILEVFDRPGPVEMDQERSHSPGFANTVIESGDRLRSAVIIDEPATLVDLGLSAGLELDLWDQG